MRCKNFYLCRKFTNIFYYKRLCKFCSINIKKSFKVLNKSDIEGKHINNTCPLCLDNMETKNKFIKLYNCNHLICSTCVKHAFYDKTFYKNMPINPIIHLRQKWNYFIDLNDNINLKNEIKNFAFYNNKETINEIINKYYSIIPDFLINDIYELILFELNRQKYIFDYNKDRDQKVKILFKCPLCRSI